MNNLEQGIDDHHTSEDRFWLEENNTESVGTGLECPECGSELLYNDNAYFQSPHRYHYRDVKCSNENCNYRDRISAE